MEYKDYYATLGVAKNASADDIQKAYRKLARKYHPDVNRSPGAEDRFKDISEAYEVLQDAEKRSTYDRYGSAWKNVGRGGAPPPGYENIHFDFGGSGASGFSSFFDSLFGNRGGGGRSPFGGGAPFGSGAPFTGGGWDPPQQDQEAKIALTLEEAASGGRREISLSDPSTGRAHTCSVNLPPGIRPGQKIRLQGKGLPGFGGGPSGDLYLKVELKPHPRFRVDGFDLHAMVPVTPWDAALGGETTVPTLNGPIKVRIPEGSSSGRKIRLRGRGMPNAKGTPGDLFAEIRVTVPEKLSEHERRLFEELQKVSSYKAK